MSIDTPMIGPATAPTVDLNDRIAQDARLAVAARAYDAAECRELGLMLGLLTPGPEGSGLTRANPWGTKRETDDLDGPDESAGSDTCDRFGSAGQSAAHSAV